MEIKGIKAIFPALDGSGYAEAARQNVIALHKLGVPVTVHSISFEQARPDLCEDGEIINSLLDKEIDYNIVFQQTTPEFYERFKEDGKAFINYTVWETDKLHYTWPDYINNTSDLCMVACDWNVEVFKRSGVTVPVVSVPHVVSTEPYVDVKPFDVAGVKEGAYIFYFIGQWTERKNPTALIKAYWRTFRRGENVALVMKVYRSDYSDSEKEAIRSTMGRMKYVCPMENYTHPPIYLILNMLSSDEVKSLHARGDCYISLDRGEGFGLSTAAAGAAGKPVIATGFGGATEYLKPDNSYLVDYANVCCHGMPWSRWYSLDQYWAYPDEKHASQLMRHVYDNQEEARGRGKLLQKYINDNLSWQVIGNKIIDAIRSL